MPLETRYKMRGMMSCLIISCSLNPESRSWILAKEAEERLGKMGVSAQLLDMRKFPLPLCDGDRSYGDPKVGELAEQIQKANAVILALPIYNYGINSAAKNLIELTGKSWTNKVVGFLCSAGGQGSYMSVMSLANSLMLDFRCLVIPRFVYATGEAFNEGSIQDKEISDRLTELVKELVRVSKALSV